jgi:outer membrane protein OmpA-like peptidoglycan-associated protein
MKKINFLIALMIIIAIAPLNIFAADNQTEMSQEPSGERINGKRVDDSRTYMEFLPPSSEKDEQHVTDAGGSTFIITKPLKIPAHPVPVPSATDTPSAPEKNSQDAGSIKETALSTAVPETILPKAREEQSTALPPRDRIRMGDTVNGSMFASGKNELSVDVLKNLNVLVERFRGKLNIRIVAVGHTDNVRVGIPETLKRFGTNQKLSEARAAAVVQYLQKALSIEDSAVTISGEGEKRPIADNKTAEGRARNRRAELSIWYEDPEPATPAVVSLKKVQPAPEQQQPATPSVLVPLAEEGAEPTLVNIMQNSGGPESQPIHAPFTNTQPEETSVCGEEGAADVNNLPFRITVDGQPVEQDSLMPEADRRRCVDVALEKNEIQIRFDPLQAKPALNCWSYPDGISRGTQVKFGVYSNYQTWIEKGEIRVFAGKTPGSKPIAVIPVLWDGLTAWTPPENAPGDMVFLLRVYDQKGRFDETAFKPLQLLDKPRPDRDLDTPDRERLTGWGLDSRRIATIPVFGGAITINGTKIRKDQTVEAFGASVPVDKYGKFAVRQILPPGPHTISVSVTDPDGRKAAFSRNLTIADDDWFYVAIADLTVGQNHASGPAALVTADTTHYDSKTYIDGRGAFYLKGLIKGEYLLTASADTSELPVKDIFSNFSSKDPRYLLKRIDPDRYYPVYGDDSTLVEDAPTQGKFYVRLERGDSHILWGNFQTQWTGNGLTQFSRALYGADLLLKSATITAYGEKKASMNAFAAIPGTMQSREEFRGTGGSLYYFHHLDITLGSERIWVEIRDKDSGLVMERRQLVPAQDYDLNCLQGRLLLASPLSSVSSIDSLINAGNIPGNPQYLVATYEYVPGVSAVDGHSLGAQGQWWINDYLRLGVAGFNQGDNEQEQRLSGMDVTARYTPDTYVKVEAAQSKGPGSGQQNSLTGGFDFSSSGAVGERAYAGKIEGQFDLSDIIESAKGNGSFYWQDKDRGFSGPGELTPGEAEKRQGGLVSLSATKDIDADVKIDDRQAASQKTRSMEGAARWLIRPDWQLAVAARNDGRWSAANASAVLSENGERTDVQGRIHYMPQIKGKDGKLQAANWDLFGYLQGTAQRTGNRSNNNRAGAGGEWQATGRFKLTAEASEGNGGIAGIVGGDYRVNDRSNAYLNYTMETERPDSSYRGRYGTAVGGTKLRINDEVSVYGETKTTYGSGPESLVHAFGLDLSPNDRWTYGLKGEFGQLNDPVSGDLKRQSGGVSLSYKKEKTKYAGALEYRHEDGTSGDRHVWLVRNSLYYQVDKDWRWFSKLDFSISRNTRGAFYDGDFVEVVTGGAYRPVLNDRFNALFKYTYFQDTPTAGQVTASSETADYIQRSHVFSADGIYDLCSYISVGAKAGYRYSRLKPSKTSGDWFDSHAMLGVARVDLHLTRKWDMIGEYRVLSIKEANDMKSGFLAGIYRHLGKNLKIGAGYNFTDFSDDMTDLSYLSHGWFINIVGQI